MNYQSIIEPIDMDLLKEIFESARRQSSDIVIIPRFLNANYNGFEIGGIQAQTLVVTSKYSNFNQLRNTPLWKNDTLSYIALYSKDIPVYLKIIKDNGLKDFYLKLSSYLVNGKIISIANEIVSTKQVLMKVSPEEFAEPEYVNPTLYLMPYMKSLDYIKEMQGKFYYSTPITKMDIDMKMDEDFLEVWSGSATEGARAWIPSIDKYDKCLQSYMLYIAKSMFTFSKSDLVTLQINKNIPNERTDIFMVKFHVTRKKGHMISDHDYYVKGFEIK